MTHRSSSKNPMPKIVGSRVLHTHYVPWLNQCDQIIGQMFRGSLDYGFLAAFERGLTPAEAVQNAFETAEHNTANRDRELIAAWLGPVKAARQ